MKKEKENKTPKKKETAAQKERKANQERFLELLPKKAYHIGKTCKAIGIHRNTIALWRNKYEDFNQAYLDVQEGKKDDDEETLYLMRRGIPLIENGVFIGWKIKPHFGALKLSLEANSRDMGYGERITIDDKREDERKKTDEELLKEIQATLNFKEDFDEDWDQDENE